MYLKRRSPLVQLVGFGEPSLCTLAIFGHSVYSNYILEPYTQSTCFRDHEFAERDADFTNQGLSTPKSPSWFFSSTIVRIPVTLSKFMLIRISGGIDSASTAIIVYSMCRLIMLAIAAKNQQVIMDVRKICMEDEWLPSSTRELCRRLFHTCAIYRV